MSTEPLPGGDPCPILVHARYSRIEIQAALRDGDRAKVPDWREGTRWLPDERTDAFLVTLNKAEGNVLTHNGLPRLRDDPFPVPLGEPVDDRP